MRVTAQQVETSGWEGRNGPGITSFAQRAGRTLAGVGAIGAMRVGDGTAPLRI